MTAGPVDPNAVTLGEVWRNVEDLKTEVKNLGAALTDIRTAVATTTVRVGVIWAALGLGSSALITALVGLVIQLLRQPT